MGQEVLLQMTDICKEFPGVKALDHGSLTVKKGTVHALMGENLSLIHICLQRSYECIGILHSGRERHPLYCR